MTKSARNAVFVAAASLVAVLAFAWFVWPTRFYYDHERFDGVGELLVRIDRITGQTEILRGYGGWRLAEQTTQHTPGALPADEIGKLQGDASITTSGWIECQVYNGSRWTVNGLSVAISLYDANNIPVFVDRQYDLSKVGDLQPRTSGKYIGEAGFTQASGQTWKWRIVKAQGFESPE